MADKPKVLCLACGHPVEHPGESGLAPQCRPCSYAESEAMDLIEWWNAQRKMALDNDG
jgi:endogenous inhibitor of DNA gyrase (YacG/DUF329 family)